MLTLMLMMMVVPESFSIASWRCQDVFPRTSNCRRIRCGSELSADSPPRRPAEMHTVAMVVSLEITAPDDEQPIFSRALAWVVLLGCIALKTKTTGPDKPQKEVVAHMLISFNTFT